MSEALKTTRRIVEIEQELEQMGGLQDQYTELIRRRLREIERQLDRKESLEQEQDELMTRLRKLTGEAPPIGRPRGKKKKSRPKKRPARLSPGQAQVLEYLRAESGNTKWLDRDDVIAHCNKYEAKTVGLYLHLLRRRGLAEDDGKYRWRSKEQQDG